MEFSIRSATPEDTPTIFRFICELAEYERLGREVTATVETLNESLFVKHQAEVLIALEDDNPVGFALFFHNFSTFKGRACLYLEDIYIQPLYRSKGYGRRLFVELAKIAVERNCERFDWAVLNWNIPSIRMYESIGAEPLPDWVIYRLKGDTLKTLASQ